MSNLSNETITQTAAAAPDKPEKKLTGKEKAFVLAYVGEAKFNATKAAELAGYKAKNKNTFSVIGYENLRKPHLSRFIENFFDDALMEAKECLMRITDVARGSIEELLDEKGEFDYKTAQENGALHLLKKLKRKRQIKDEIIYEEIEFELHDRLAALQMIGKHHKLFTDNHHLSGDLEFVTFEIETGDGRKLPEAE